MKALKMMLFLLLIPFSAVDAGTLTIIGDCHSDPIFSESFNIENEQTVGGITTAMFNERSIPYEGTERGINSILNTPTGLEALEVISDSEMFAYGWCYSLNGFEPALFPHQVQVVQGDKIVWWFGYAHFKNGEWVSQCEPSYQRVPSLVCPIE